MDSEAEGLHRGVVRGLRRLRHAVRGIDDQLLRALQQGPDSSWGRIARRRDAFVAVVVVPSAL